MRPAELDDQEDVVHVARERQRVDDVGERRRVDDHVVGDLACVVDQLARGGEREELGDPAALVVGQEEAEVRTELLGRHERVLEVDAFDEDADHAVGRA